MNDIDNTLNKIIKGRKNKEKYSLAYIQIHWKSIIGNRFYEKSEPANIQNGVLFLNVINSSWAHNFLIIKEELLSKINEKISGIKDIKFIVQKNIKKYDIENDIENKEDVFPSISKEEQIVIYNNIGKVKDPILFKKIKNIAIKNARRIKYFKNKGFSNCIICGAALSYKGDKCITCKKNYKNYLKSEIFSILYQIPWINYEDIKTDFNIEKNYFLLIRDECMHSFLEKAQRNNATKNDINRYVMLKNNCSIDKLNEELINKTMKEAKSYKNVFTFRSSYNDKYKKYNRYI